MRIIKRKLDKDQEEYEVEFIPYGEILFLILVIMVFLPHVLYWIFGD